LNHSLLTAQQLLQYSLQSTLTILIVSGLLVLGWMLFLKNQKANSDSPENSISIKIDHNGKYKYEVVPNSGNSNLKFWIRIIIAIIALAVLWIPIKSLFNPQY
jgi:high-affinity Fe2+/Pb2+ permease